MRFPTPPGSGFLARRTHELREVLHVRDQSSRFLSEIEQTRIFLPENRGLVLDGKRKRLGHGDSFKHCGIFTPTGGGKTTIFIKPNILTLDGVSMVVTDPSGELYRDTAEFKRLQGYEIKVFNLDDPSTGSQFNPHIRAKTYLDIYRLCEVIMRSKFPLVSAGEQYWVDEPQAPMAVLLACLRNAGRPEFNNPHNLLALLRKFGASGEPLEDFVAANYGHESILQEWISITGLHERQLSSVLSMARNALRIYGIPSIAQLTSGDDFDFGRIRERKTMIYVIASERYARFLQPLLNIFYTQLFTAQYHHRYVRSPDRRGAHPFIPLYCFLDEFGSAYVPDFDELTSKIRKYEVSLVVALQSEAQLTDKYGPNQAQTILENLHTHVFYKGVNPKTAKAVSNAIGSKRALFRSQKPLLPPDRVNRIYANEAIVLKNGEEPMLLEVTPFYKTRSLKKRTKKKAKIERQNRAPVVYHPEATHIPTPKLPLDSTGPN